MATSRAYELGQLAARIETKPDLLEEFKGQAGKFAEWAGPGVASAYNQAVPDPAKAFLGAAGQVLGAGNEYFTKPFFGEAYRRAARGELGGLTPQLLDSFLWSSVSGQGAYGQHYLDALRKYSPQQIQSIANAPGGREAFEESFSNDPLGSFFVQGVYDPANLAGLGLGTAAGKVLGKGAQAAAIAGRAATTGEKVAQRVGRTIELSDEALNRIQALPITAPIAGAKLAGKGLNKLSGGNLGKAWEAAATRTGISRLRKAGSELRSAEEARMSAGETDIATRLSRNLYDEASLEAPANLPTYFASLYPSAVHRVYLEAGDRGNSTLRAAALAYLDNSGLTSRVTLANGKQGLHPSERLAAHTRLDDSLRGIQFGEVSNETLHDLLDRYVIGVFDDNPSAFKNKLENVYDSLDFEATPDTLRSPGSLHQNWVMAVGDALDPRPVSPRQLSAQTLAAKSLTRELNKLTPRQSIESLLTTSGKANPNLEKWYLRSAQFIYHLGFDHSRAFTDPSQVEAILASPAAMKVKTDLGIADEEVLDRLQNLSKQEVFLALLAGTSIRSNPAQNLYQALRGYRSLLDGDSLETVIGGLGLKTEKVTARLLLPEGLLPISYQREVRAEKLGRRSDSVRSPSSDRGYKLQPGFEYPKTGVAATLQGQPTAHGVPDKLEQYVQSFKGELEAYETYQQARLAGSDHATALKQFRDKRAEVNSFVHDTWSRLGYLDRSRWIDPEKIFNGDIPAVGADVEDYLKKLIKPPAGVAAWQATKQRIADDYAYLTGKPNPITGEVPTSASPNADEWARRLPNLAAYQSRLWAIFRVEGGLARDILADLRNPKTGLLEDWQNRAYAQADEVTGIEEISRLFQGELRRRFDEASARHVQGYEAAQAATEGGDYNALRTLETAPGQRTQPFNSPQDLGAVAAASAEDALTRQLQMRQWAEGRRKSLPKAPAQDIEIAWKAIAEDVQAPKADTGELGYQLPSGDVVPYIQLTGDGGRKVSAAEALFLGDYSYLSQRLESAGQVRGTFSAPAPGRFLIRVTPHANITTIPHELQHLFLKTSSPESLAIQSQAAYGARVPRRWTPSGVEKLAEGGENFLLDVDLSLLSDPGLRTTLQTYRQLADAAYLRGRPKGRLGPTAEELQIARLEGTPGPAVPLGAIAPAGGLPTSPMPQLVEDYADSAAFLAGKKSGEIEVDAPILGGRLRDGGTVSPGGPPEVRDLRNYVRGVVNPVPGVPHEMSLRPAFEEAETRGAEIDSVRTQETANWLEDRAVGQAIEQSQAAQKRLQETTTDFGVFGVEPDSTKGQLLAYLPASSRHRFIRDLDRYGLDISEMSDQELYLHLGGFLSDTGLPVPAANLDDAWRTLTGGLDTTPDDAARRLLDEYRGTETSPEELEMASRRTLTGTPAYTTAPTISDTAPRSNASVREVMDQIGGELRAQPAQVDAATRMVEDLFKRADSPMQANLLWVGPFRRHAEEMISASDDAVRKTSLVNLAEEMNATWKGFGVVLPGLMRLIDGILLPNKPTPKIGGDIGRSNFMSSLPDRQAELLAKADALPEVQAWRAEFDKAQADVKALATSKGWVIDDFTRDKDIRNWAEALPKAERDVVEKYLKLGGWVDPATGTARNIASAGYEDAWIKAVAKEYGVDLTRKPKVVETIAATAIRGWKEQALTSVRNLASNVLDMTFKTVSNGYMPLIGDSAYTKAQRLGISIPPKVSDPRGQGKTLLPHDLAEAATSDQLVLGNVPVYGGLVRFFRNANHVAESTFRTWAWAGEIENYLQDASKVFLGEVNRRAGKPLADVLRARGTEFSPADVLREARTLGISPELTNELESLWSRNVGEASTRGEAAADRVHFDYTSELNIEKYSFIRWWGGFHFWATRNLPYYTQTLAQNPWMLRLWNDWHALSEEERQKTGLTSRFKETLPIYIRDPFLAAIFGPNTPYFNPTVIMSIADQMKPISEDPDTPPLGKALIAAGRVGLRPAPWVDIPLAALGVYGEDYEPGNVLRMSGLASAGLSTATGKAIDLEAPIKSAVDAARGAPTPLSRETLGGLPVGGSRLNDYLIQKRLGEMSLETMGIPNHPDYVQAMTNPVSRLYQQAAAQVFRESLGQAVTGFVSPIPIKTLSDTEAVIRQRAADVRPFLEQLPETGRKAANQMMAQGGDLATSYWRVGSDPRVAQIQSGLAALDTYSRGPVGHLARQMEQSGNPLLDAYLRWVRSLPPFVTERSPADFVKTL